jgi:hypothetical protein
VIGFQGSGFWVLRLGLGFRGWDFRVLGSGFQGSGFWALSLGFGLWALGFKV